MKLSLSHCYLTFSHCPRYFHTGLLAASYILTLYSPFPTGLPPPPFHLHPVAHLRVAFISPPQRSPSELSHSPNLLPSFHPSFLSPPSPLSQPYIPRNLHLHHSLHSDLPIPSSTRLRSIARPQPAAHNHTPSTHQPVLSPARRRAQRMSAASRAVASTASSAYFS